MYHAAQMVMTNEAPSTHHSTTFSVVIPAGFSSPKTVPLRTWAQTVSILHKRIRMMAVCSQVDGHQLLGQSKNGSDGEHPETHADRCEATSNMTPVGFSISAFNDDLPLTPELSNAQEWQTILP